MVQSVYAVIVCRKQTVLNLEGSGKSDWLLRQQLLLIINQGGKEMSSNYLATI
jgi:hypothetical protein